MKILFLSHRIPWPVRDGGCLAIHNNLKGFVEAGCTVKLLCLNPKKDGTDLSQLPAWFQRCEPEAIAIDTSVRPLDAFLNLFGSKSYHVQRFSSKAFAQLLRRVLQSEEFDVVHLEGAFIGQYVPEIRKHSKSCVVLREHNLEYRIWEGMALGTSNPLRKAYLRLLAKRLKRYEEHLWKQVDAVEAISSADLEEFIRFCPNSFLGGLGFELESYYQTDAMALPNSLFHLGSMDWLPNREAVRWLLEEIWPVIHSEFPQYSLHLAGKKMPPEWQIREKDLVVEGEVDSASDYMSLHEIMVVPLKSGSGIRVKILEAMALGRVVISTTAGIQGIDAEDRIEYIRADSPAEFVDALKWLEADPERKQKLAAAARELVRTRYDNQVHISRLLEKYRNCAQG